MTNIAVPPIPIRPSVIMDGAQRSFTPSFKHSTLLVFLVILAVLAVNYIFLFCESSIMMLKF